MAKKKRKTLPKNFKELIEVGDMAALKAVYDDCELAATGGYDKETALHCYNVPDELVRWLVEQGLDINTPSNTYRRTPLHEHATFGDKTVKLLLNLSADVEAADYNGDTPLHKAAGYHRVDAVQLLIEHGADIHAKNRANQTPLSYALARCENINISGMAEIARILLEAGARVKPDMAKSVKRIGEGFEFHRANFNEEYLAETDAGLSKLYSIFNVEVIAKREMHDGISPIAVSAAKWQKQYAELWNLLVPSQGAAKTVQGEVIRITGRVSDELQRNGGANWDTYYRKMLDVLLRYFAFGTSLSAIELSEVAALVADIRPKGESDGDERLCELAVKWVLKNPNPISLDKTDYKR
ncbi:MAG: ankyrin repeat domain-containing protein [Azoarcus sp.]|nr:ankyrin repeat domain-containing protein [Azoarcus sp.]